MFRALMLGLLFASSCVSASPFLICDVTDSRADTVILTRAGVSTNSPVVVDAVNGLPANGNRTCHIDLASDPRTGTVTVALKDSIQGDTGPAASFTFGSPLHAPGNLRLIP